MKLNVCKNLRQMNLLMHFIEILNLVPVACEVLWALVQTG